jgi:hypothetical protein
MERLRIDLDRATWWGLTLASIHHPPDTVISRSPKTHKKSAHISPESIDNDSVSGDRCYLLLVCCSLSGVCLLRYLLRDHWTLVDERGKERPGAARCDSSHLRGARGIVVLDLGSASCRPEAEGRGPATLFSYPATATKRHVVIFGRSLVKSHALPGMRAWLPPW